MKRLLVTLQALVLSGCLSLTTPPTLVPQREENDCAVAVLAMAAHVSYETAIAAFKAANANYKDGSDYNEVMAVAKVLHIKLIPEENINPFTATGVIVVLWCGGQSAHAIYVKDGVVYDPGGLTGPVTSWFDVACVQQAWFYRVEVVRDGS